MNIAHLNISTQVVRGVTGVDQTTGAVSFPIYQSATFRHLGFGESTGFDYSRLQNPTRQEVERTVALLEEGAEGLGFSTGMAAISTVIKLFKSGDHLVVSDDLYGGTYRILTEIYSRYGIEVSFVDTGNEEEVISAIKDNTKALFIETPTNPTMKITDIKAMVKIGKQYKVLLIVDNTFLTPYFQKPLVLGADIVVHSGTKYLAGHNDTLAGFVVANDPLLINELRLIQMSEGAVLAPFDSWLVLRGIKTLSIRLKKQEENAMILAKWLEAEETIESVIYCGLETHPGYLRMKEQATGFGGMIGFYLKEASFVPRFLNQLKLIYFAESLGGVETLITYPAVQTHAAIPKETRDKIGVTDTLLRLSVGIEDVSDLIADIKQSLEGLKK